MIACFGAAFQHGFGPAILVMTRVYPGLKRRRFLSINEPGQAKRLKNVSILRRIEVASLENIRDHDAKEIVAAVSQEGCVIVQQKGEAPVNHSQALARLGRHFGKPIRHRLSDENGVHPIRTIPGYASYANTTSADLLLHTDGSFEEHPPRVMLMSCEMPAASGGHTRICFARDIHSRLSQNFPADIAGLWLPDSFTIRRDDRKSSKPVFRHVGNGRIAISFRFGNDVEIEVRPEAASGYQRIVSLLSDPANFLEFKLQRNELLAFDNTAVLHGRTDFPAGSGRILHGLWLDGAPENGELTLGFSGETQIC
jgi:alpha-ketoglutarate-dependent taurine dioxygenase